MTHAALLMLKESMHTISTVLLAPTIALLLAFIAYVVFELGSLLVEFITERRQVKDKPGEVINSFQMGDLNQIVRVIDKSKLGIRHKAALKELITYNGLSAAAQQAIARQLLADEELHYVKITNRTDLLARLGPMLGLIATLIPLGPGLIALGEGNTQMLADSLLTAFDATVTGLAVGGIAFGISQLRKRWYEGYLSSLEALLEILLEVLANERGVKE